MKHDQRHHLKYRYPSNPARGPVCRRNGGSGIPLNTITERFDADVGVSDGTVENNNLLDELQALLDRLGAAKISLTLYLIEFVGLPLRLALPLLQEAAGSCAMLRLPAPGQHLVIFLGPEPSLEAGGFLGRLKRGLDAMAPTSMPACAWAEVRMLRRGNHEIAAPAYLLLDLNAAARRIVGLTNW